MSCVTVAAKCITPVTDKRGKPNGENKTRLDESAYELRFKFLDVDGGGGVFACSARVVINAAGPFVDAVNFDLDVRTDHRIVYSKGIHLIVPQITPNHRVLAFYDDTQRLFYVIPMGRRSVIGTTDTRVDTPFTEVDDEDRDFLLDQINRRLDLEHPLTRDDIIADRSGVRPLVVASGDGDGKDVDWTKL